MKNYVKINDISIKNIKSIEIINNLTFKIRYLVFFGIIIYVM